MDTNKPSGLPEKVEYWVEVADYDIETARTMLDGRRYLYVGFMCHQTIEKALKAVIARDCTDSEIPPKIHDLPKLAVKAKIFDLMTEQQKIFLDNLNPLNVRARYPDYKDKIGAQFTKENCTELITTTEELLCWIKQKL
jgi:HEPN domain-containing protein